MDRYGGEVGPPVLSRRGGHRQAGQSYTNHGKNDETLKPNDASRVYAMAASVVLTRPFDSTVGGQDLSRLRLGPAGLPPAPSRDLPPDPASLSRTDLAHGDGTYPIVLARFAWVDVLILDDWGLVRLKDAQRQDLLEILDDRNGTRSTLPVSSRAIAGTSTWVIRP
jgi:hypothetical protein